MMTSILYESEKKTMYETISLANLSHEDWLRLRKTGIGGSDAGAICGLNPYSSAMHVYWDKISQELIREDKEAMRQGRDLEEYVAKRFCEATGFKVRRCNLMYRSKKNPFMIADIDRFVVGQPAGLECKTANAYQAEKWKHGEIPPHYLLQCCHYMAVTGKKEWYLAVVILGREFQYRKITWNDQVIQNLIAIEREFWTSHILQRRLPSPDGSNAFEEALGTYFPLAKKGSSIPLVGFDEKLNRREELIRLIKKLEQEQKQIEQEVKCFMKENELAESASYRVSWSNVETTKLDTKRVKEEEPQLYENFSKTTTSRRFTVRAA